MTEMMHTVAVIAMGGVITSFAIGPGVSVHRTRHHLTTFSVLCAHHASASVQCIGWFVIAEIFPAYATDAAMALGVTLNWLANWVVAFTFPLINSVLGPYSFLIFAMSTCCFGLFTYHFVPETRSKTTSALHAELVESTSSFARYLGAL
tara:strand:- start:427 stop:873 length:447 start_codon:yes stop_codon:yes gene_type:complete